jgi:hypothetical protein
MLKYPMKRSLRYLPWVFAGVGVLVTVVFTICEATGNSLGRYVSLEPIMGVSELSGWLFFLGDNADTRAQLYIWGLPFGAAWNGFVGWLLGLLISAAFTRRFSVLTLLIVTTLVALMLGVIVLAD